MAKDGKHVIHAGGIFPNPQLNREGSAAAAFLPGTVIFSVQPSLPVSVDGAGRRNSLRCPTTTIALQNG